MKRFLILLIASTTLAAVATACQKTKPLDRDPYAIQIDGRFVAPPTQASAPSSKVDKYVNFIKDDKVGLYMVDFTAASTHGTLGVSGNTANNVCFTADAAGTLMTTPPVYYTKDFAWNVDIFAYSPYITTVTSVTACPFNIATDQATTAKMAASDLCWTSTGADGVAVSSKPVALIFKHKFSKIELILHIPTSLSGKAVSDVTELKFNNVATNTTFNMSTGVVTTATATKAAITPLITTGKTTVGEVITYEYALILPVQTFTIADNLITFKLNFTDPQNVSREMVYKVPAALFGANSTQTKEGTIHKMELTMISNSEILLTSSTITDWAGGTTETQDFTNRITTVFSITPSAITNLAQCNRVKVTTDESATVYDIKNSDVAGSVSVSGGKCSFYFTEKSSSPYDYGFKITKIEFFNGDTSLGSKTLVNAARVYSPTTMDLGTL
ncbi:MAG: fimbrillin family protein [Mucinivorans sp.]